MTAFYICLSVLLFFLLVLILVGYAVFGFASRRWHERENTFEGTFLKILDNEAFIKKLRPDYEWFDSITPEGIEIRSHDGLMLYADLLRVKDIPAKGTVILFHGYRSAARRDFCLQIRILYEAGYNVIAAHQRAHGKSEGKYLCYGLNERRDAMLWRKKASEIFGQDMPTALMGLSMGGATVLMASGLASEEDTSLRCVIADCPFSSPWDIIKEVTWSKYRIYPYPVMYFTNLWFMLLAKCNLKSTSSSESVATTHLPILVIHGDNDTFVVPEHSKKVAAASDSVKLVLIPNANHAQAIFYDEELYKKELLSFLDKHM